MSSTAVWRAISRYSVRSKVQRLPLEPTSKASADQRRGRCGREAPGICIRLYSEEDFAAREEFTPPEILRTHLASVLLQMAASQLGDPEDFPFPDPPDSRQINDGVRQLQELGAMDERRQITHTGRRIGGAAVRSEAGAHAAGRGAAAVPGGAAGHHRISRRAGSARAAGGCAGAVR